LSIFVIAEAGINHDGKFGEALKLVNAAKRAGADAVKFQLFSSFRLWGDDRIKHLELSEVQMKDIAAYCKSAGIEFMCTPFGVSEIEFLAPLVKRMKIASGCLHRRELLHAVELTRLPAILSTGMSTIAEVSAALDDLQDCENLTLLHCTSAYPCPLTDVNLLAMDTLGAHFKCDIGYSDHTEGSVIAIATAARGATVIEKHLTLDRNAEGPDHKASIEPHEFRAMVKAIREVEAALGDGVKRVQESELELRKAWGRD